MRGVVRYYIVVTYTVSGSRSSTASRRWPVRCATRFGARRSQPVGTVRRVPAKVTISGTSEPRNLRTVSRRTSSTGRRASRATVPDSELAEPRPKLSSSAPVGRGATADPLSDSRSTRAPTRRTSLASPRRDQVRRGSAAPRRSSRRPPGARPRFEGRRGAVPTRRRRAGPPRRLEDSIPRRAARRGEWRGRPRRSRRPRHLEFDSEEFPCSSPCSPGRTYEIITHQHSVRAFLTNSKNVYGIRPVTRDVEHGRLQPDGRHDRPPPRDAVDRFYQPRTRAVDEVFRRRSRATTTCRGLRRPLGRKRHRFHRSSSTMPADQDASKGWIQPPKSTTTATAVRSSDRAKDPDCRGVHREQAPVPEEAMRVT